MRVGCWAPHCPYRPLLTQFGLVAASNGWFFIHVDFDMIYLFQVNFGGTAAILSSVL